MLKIMKFEMLIIIKKKFRYFCFICIFINFNYRRDNLIKYKVLEGRFLGNSFVFFIFIVFSFFVLFKNCNMLFNLFLLIYSLLLFSDVLFNIVL